MFLQVKWFDTKGEIRNSIFKSHLVRAYRSQFILVAVIYRYLSQSPSSVILVLELMKLNYLLH